MPSFRKPYEAIHNYELFQPQKSNLAIPKAFPAYFDFKNMNLPVATRACEHEAVWLDENIFCTGHKGVDDAVAAIKKIQHNTQDEQGLRRVEEEVRKVGMQAGKNKRPRLVLK